jgi:hypothetical protein
MLDSILKGSSSGQLIFIIHKSKSCNNLCIFVHSQFIELPVPSQKSIHVLGYRFSLCFYGFRVDFIFFMSNIICMNRNVSIRGLNCIRYINVWQPKTNKQILNSNAANEFTMLQTRKISFWCGMRHGKCIFMQNSLPLLIAAEP